MHGVVKRDGSEKLTWEIEDKENGTKVEERRGADSWVPFHLLQEHEREEALLSRGLMTPGGDSEFCASMWDTVAFIKERIQSSRGFPIAQQRLMFKGGTLEDGCALRDYGIGDGDTVQLVLCEEWVS